jgi:hypothetical protein
VNGAGGRGAAGGAGGAGGPAIGAGGILRWYNGLLATGKSSLLLSQGMFLV